MSWGGDVGPPDGGTHSIKATELRTDLVRPAGAQKKRRLGCMAAGGGAGEVRWLPLDSGPHFGYTLSSKSLQISKLCTLFWRKKPPTRHFNCPLVWLKPWLHIQPQERGLGFRAVGVLGFGGLGFRV